MPEGDTIFRTARTLNRALAGRVVTQFETQFPALARVDYDTPIAGRVVESVESSGKWLMMHFSGGLILLTHMLMSGSWHIYRPGEAWQRSRQQMRVAIHTDAFVAVAFQIQIAEFHTADSLRRHRSVSRLGPDVLAEEFDEADAAARLAAQPELEVGVALLSQSIVAGMGNVYKSEVCFAAGVNPFRRIGSLTREELRALVSNARKYMLANVTDDSGDQIVTYTGFRRTTRRADPAEELWVYRRRGEPCRRCNSAILSRKQGLDARVTFWCPQCQP
jgi:endonuclease-8